MLLLETLEMDSIMRQETSVRQNTQEPTLMLLLTSAEIDGMLQIFR